MSVVAVSSQVHLRDAASARRLNFLATVLLSAGVPRIFGRYAHDTEVSRFDWNRVDKNLFAFTAEMVRLRREDPALVAGLISGPISELTSSVGSDAGSVLGSSQGAGMLGDDAVQVIASDGSVVGSAGASAHGSSVGAAGKPGAVMFLLRQPGEDAFVLLLNASTTSTDFTLPAAPHGEWELESSSDPEQSVDCGGGQLDAGVGLTGVSQSAATLRVRDASFTLLRSRANERE